MHTVTLCIIAYIGSKFLYTNHIMIECEDWYAWSWSIVGRRLPCLWPPDDQSKLASSTCAARIPLSGDCIHLDQCLTPVTVDPGEIPDLPVHLTRNDIRKPYTYCKETQFYWQTCGVEQCIPVHLCNCHSPALLPYRFRKRHGFTLIPAWCGLQWLQ